MDSLFSRLCAAAGRFSERTAISSESRSFTYSELLARVEEESEFLAANGAGPGISFVHALQDPLVAITALFACSKIGAAFSPRRTDADRFERCAPHAALVLNSSGTTGHPSRVEIEERNLLSAAERAIAAAELKDSDTGLNCMSMAHTGGYNVLTLPLLFVGGHVRLLNRPGKTELVRQSELLRPSLLHCTPAAAAGIFSEYGALESMGRLRLLILGGSRISPELLRRLHAAGIPEILRCYGLTQATPPIFTARSRSESDELETLGELAGRDLAFRVAPDTELFLREGEDAWIATGDLATLDSRGGLRFLDRKPHVLKHRGLAIFPAKLEDAVLKVPSVRECCVVGARDSSPLGLEDENIFVFYSLNAHSDAETSNEAICAALRPALPAPSIVWRSVGLEVLPKTENGKIDRLAIKRLATELVTG